MVDITIVNGGYNFYKPTNITAGPHPVLSGYLTKSSPEAMAHDPGNNGGNPSSAKTFPSFSGISWAADRSVGAAWNIMNPSQSLGPSG